MGLLDLDGIRKECEADRVRFKNLCFTNRDANFCWSHSMKITATGWQRNMGPNTLMDAPLIRMPSGPDFSDLETTTSGVQIRWKKFGVGLHGDYFFSAYLTKEDIARLFVQAFAGADFHTVLNLLEEAPQHTEKPKPPRGDATPLRIEGLVVANCPQCQHSQFCEEESTTHCLYCGSRFRVTSELHPIVISEDRQE